MLQVAPKSTSFGIRKLVAAGSSLMGVPTIFTVPFQFFCLVNKETLHGPFIWCKHGMMSCCRFWLGLDPISLADKPSYVIIHSYLYAQLQLPGSGINKFHVSRHTIFRGTYILFGGLEHEFYDFLYIGKLCFPN